MTGKLLKYDLRSMMRNFVPLWGALLAVSVVNFFSVRFSAYQREAFQLPALVGLLVYASLVVAVLVVTAVLVVQRFYQGLLRDEGYLMFTLPVRPWQLVTSKLLAAFLVCLGSAVVGVLSATVIVLDQMDLGSVWAGLLLLLGAYWAPTLSMLFLAIAVGLCSITQIYVSLALGHLAHRCRIGWAVGIYIAIHMAFTWLELGVGRYIPVPVFEEAAPYLLLLTGYYLLRTALFFVATERILSQKLNLE